MNMGRNCRALVRQFLGSSGSNPSAALVHHYHKLSCNSIHTLLLGLTSIPTIPSSPTTIASTSKPFSNFFCAPNLHLLQHRRLVSSPPDRLLVKVIATKDDYDLEVKKIQVGTMHVCPEILWSYNPACMNQALLAETGLKLLQITRGVS